MNKKVLLLASVFITICIFFSACGIKNNNTVTEKTATDDRMKSEEESQKQKEFELLKKIYTKRNVRVEYPQIINLTDEKNKKR